MDNYWAKRAIVRQAFYDQSATHAVKVTQRAITRSLGTLKQEMDNVLRVYAKRHSLTRKEAEALLKSPVDEATQQRLMQEIKTISSPKARRLMQAQIESASYGARLTRAQAMQDRIVLEACKIATVEEDALMRHLSYTYHEGIDRMMYDIQRGVGRMFEYSQPSIQRAQEVLRHRWAGGNYSSRIWANAGAMTKQLEYAMMENMLAGKTSDKTWEAIVDAAGSEVSYAERLIRTETAYIANQSELYAYMEAGIQKYEYVAVLEARTCPVCGKLDGQVFDITDSRVGKNYPPIHPWCRCTTSPWDEDIAATLDENDTRWSRDPETGEDIDMPMNMTYYEWSKAKEIGKLEELAIEKNTLAKLNHEIHAKDADHVFKGIWKDDVTFADWEARKGSIQAKRDYYEKAIKRALNNGYPADELQEHLKELDYFEAHGQENYDLLQQRKEAEARIDDIKKQFIPDTKTGGTFGPDAYSQARKDAALWDTAENVDKALRQRTGEVWRQATDEEKDAIYDYTTSYSKFNEPLRGIEYGTSRFLGVGNTDLDAGYKHNGKALNAMTSIIDKCSYDRDMWLQRGVSYGGMDKFFQCDESLLRYGTQEELEKELLGKDVIEYGFMSCGTAKGQGFSHNPIIMNIYAPKGTKAMYAEPFSAYGRGDQRGWDGLSGQSSFGSEFETILQQGTRFRIVKIERTGTGTIYMDLEVVAQDKKQLYNP